MNAFTIASKVSGKELNHSYLRSVWISLSLLVWYNFQDGTWPLEILNYIRGAAKITWQQQQTVKKGFRGLCKSQPLGCSAVSVCQPRAPDPGTPQHAVAGMLKAVPQPAHRGTSLQNLCWTHLAVIVLTSVGKAQKCPSGEWSRLSSSSLRPQPKGRDCH